MKRVIALAAGLAALFAAGPATATDFPTKPITLIIGFAPGGPSDVMSRIITKRMEQDLKQPIVIENKPGAGGSIAGAYVARAEPDGYTMLLATGSLLAINVHLYKNVGYDPVKDFAPIGLLGTQTNVLYTHPSVPANTFPELLKLLKENPGKYNFGSGGVGVPAHLAGELLKIKAGVNIQHVPFRGTGPSLQAVIAGHIQMAFNPPPPLIPHIKAGTIKAIAVTTLKRTAALPDVPTIAESGFPGFEAQTWHGLVAPANTPKDIVETLNRAFVAALRDPAVKQQLTELGVDVEGSSPGEFAAYIKSEIPKWAEIVQAASLKPQ
ncbi:MAG TPA: tripartite tricarboxylate transporter substrate binding protein [Xanthobacteraceae bacterium]|nr:tripartite tricarboxylate transporter substrate binding protein [Xanthobacteraceae bacterium]